MSTDRKRLTSSIQRIAREDPEIRKLLDDFRNSGGKPSETATSGSGAEDRQICCDGSTSGSANPGSGTKDPGAGGQDASDGLGDDPADLDMGGGSLTGVKDCATDQPICFDGSDWIPPDLWESPTEPPTDPFFQEGVYWVVEGTTSKGSSPSIAMANHIALIREGSESSHENVRISDLEKTNDTTVYVTGYWTNPSTGQEVISEGPVNQTVCTGSDGAWCSDTEAPIIPGNEKWPEDGCVNLAQKGGKLVGSKYDPENDGSYSKPRNSIELCDDFGNSFELSPSASGGWKTINSTTDNGYLYDSSGQQIAHIDGNEYSDPSV